jgi:hypothetical protein
MVGGLEVSNATAWTFTLLFLGGLMIMNFIG